MNIEEMLKKIKNKEGIKIANISCGICTFNCKTCNSKTIKNNKVNS